MLYLAYGSNMLIRRLVERVQSATLVSTCKVTGFTLAWDKISKDGSGKCTIVVSENVSSNVFGGIFEIDSSDLPILDRVEGCGSGYDRKQITVQDRNNNAQNVTTYVAANQFRRSSLKPYTWYHNIVMAGARQLGLPASYVEELSSIESIRDPDCERRNRNQYI